jgi:putative transposase
MIRFCFKKGLRFLENQITRQLVRRLATGKLQFERDTGEIENFDDREVMAKWHAGQWVIDEDSLSSASDVLYLATPRDLATYPAQTQAKVRRREQYLRHVDPENTLYNPVVWGQKIKAAAALMDDPKPPGPSTVHAWWRRFRNTRSIMTLVPKMFGGNPQSPDTRFKIFEETIAESYLTAQRIPQNAVYEIVRKKILALNVGREPEAQIKPVSRTTIYNWITRLRQDIVDASRLGADAARVKYRMVSGTLKVSSVLERVEIDHTPLDIIVIDKNTTIPLGRPWMSLAIDRYSRMIVGFYLSFNAPSSHSVLQCLRQSILPKEAWLARFPDIKGEWPACGIMDLIALDNGLDLHSDALESACQELGIQQLFCPAGKPQFKGAVERCFRTLAKGLIHRLPGTVFSSVDERGQYPAEELAAVDLETLTYVITRWIVDIYSVTYHRGLGTTPLLKWRESASKRVIELPAYPEQLAVITGIPATRTLFHYGIELEGLHYNSRELQEMRRRTGDSRKVGLKFYEDSVEYVHVYDDHGKEYIRVPAINSDYAANLPRGVHRLIREHARRTFGEQYSIAQMEEAREAIEEKIKASLDFKRMATRKLGASLLHADSESVLRNEDPLMSARQPVDSMTEKSLADLPEGLDDKLPRFDAIELGTVGRVLP